MNFLLSALSNPGTTTPYDLEEALQVPNGGELGLKWYIVPIFVILFYCIAKEIKAKRYSVVFGGFAFWLWDVFNETWNSMVYATTGQPVWGTTAAGNSALQILVGYNIEISFMFMFLGMATCHLLTTTAGYEGERFMDANKNWLSDVNNLYYKANVKSKDLTYIERRTKRKAILNRMSVIVFGSIAAVVIEILLNACNVLTWEKPWWQPNFPFVLFIIGYVPFFVAAVIIHDLPRKYQLIGLGIEILIVALLLIIAGSLGMLGRQIEVVDASTEQYRWVGNWLNDNAQLIGNWVK